MEYILPDEYKNLRSVKDFKATIRSWVPENCPCRLLKIYIQHKGYISLPEIFDSLNSEVGGWGES